MKNSASKILEIVWFILGLTCVLATVLISIDKGFNSSALFFTFALISFFMWYIRRRMRNKISGKNE